MSAEAVDSAEVYRRLRKVEDDSLTNRLNLSTHEKECALRQGYIKAELEATNSTMDGMRGDMRKVASIGAGIGLAVLGFLIKLVFFPSA